MPRAARATKRRLPSSDAETEKPVKDKKIPKVNNVSSKTDNTLSEASFTNAGVVLTFGTGDVGQLGLGEDVVEKLRPALVPGVKDVVQISAGGMHNICLTNTGEVLTWGCNDEGALGREASESECFEPKKVDLPKPAIMVSAGDSHSAALLEDGRVFVWGSFRDASGTMGLINLDKIEKKPINVVSNAYGFKIASGGDHLVILTNSNHIYTIGCGQQGQLGRLACRETNREHRKGIATSLSPDFVKVNGGRKLKGKNIWTGTYSTFVLSNNKDVYVFGLNNFHQIGLPDQEPYFRPTKTNAFNGISIKKICGGLHHTLVLDENGKVYALGRKEYGRLGLGKNCEDAIAPVEIPTLAELTCVDIGCGDSTSFAVTDSGDLYAWGMGTSGALGVGDVEDLHEPTLVKGKQLAERSAIQVAGGGQHSIVLATTKNNNTNNA